MKSKRPTKGSNADKNGQFPTLITLWPVRLLMFCVSSLLSTQTFLPEPVVFMINSFHLISRPSLYLSVPVMMLSYALAFPPFPLIFIKMPHLPLTFIMLSANQALLDKYRLSFPMLPKKNTAYCQVWGLEFERWEGCVILIIIDVQCI